MKRLLSVALTILFTLSFANSIAAHDITNNVPDIDFVALQMGEIISPLLDTNEFGINESNYNNLYVGSPIPIYKYNNNSLSDMTVQYPIICEDAIIGFARVLSYGTGEKTIDYGTDCASEINVYLKENNASSFCLIYTDNGVYIGNKGKMRLIRSYDNDISNIEQYWEIASNVSASKLTYGSISCQKKIVVPLSEMSVQAVEHNSLNIDYIHQNGNTCWAASIASIVNYLFDLDEDIISILELADSMDIIQTGKDGVNISNAKKILDTFGGSNTRYNTYITYTRLKNYIDNGYPAYIRGDSTTGGDTGHASVAYGYYYSGTGSKYMYYMEPNTGYRTAGFPSSGGIIFTTGSTDYLNDAYILCRN